MDEQSRSRINRREFLQTTALAAGSMVVGSLAGCAGEGISADRHVPGGITILYNGDQSSGKWAVEHLRRTLADRNVRATVCTQNDEVNPTDLCIEAEHLSLTDKSQTPDMVSLEPNTKDNRRIIRAKGTGRAGLVYALAELAEIAAFSPDPIVALSQVEPITETPANRIRSVMRMFVSDVEDKSWYNDRNFWTSYLTMLATNRFNRINLSLGLGYDGPSGLADSYFFFAYPFLLSVPGYDVRAANLPDSERDRNLEMLRFISDEAANRGLDFQLGLWTHAYVFPNSPNVNHTIEGLSNDKQGPYCRDALALLLKECPNITGVTFRIHGESGVPEGSYDLWRTIFDGCVRSGRKVEIDMHAKGMDQETIDVALGTGLPITISPKYWAEHMGLPYHQSSIRPTELPRQARGGGAFANSNGARSFLRYGWGDLLKKDRKYAILHRMWPGTQHFLLWGDPTFAASYGRASSFCGTQGCEIMEPLSFKGRKGSGLPGHRAGYADASLIPPGGDFEKYRYCYRVWGRLLYNPDANPQVWQRQLKNEYGPAAEHVETALSRASRILPLFTTAHLPAAANNNYEPEMYVNMSIVAETAPSPYGSSETPAPRRFGTVNPLDPQLFYRVEDYVDDLLKGPVNGKYSPLEVAQWLEDLAQSAVENLNKAKSGSDSAAFRRAEIDITVQSNLGQFFAHKYRAAVLYAIYDRTGERGALEAAIKQYRIARDFWASIIDQTRGIYVEDLTFGNGFFQRGNWSNRIEAIDRDIETMANRQPPAQPIAVAPETIAALMRAVQARPERPAIDVTHHSPASFQPGQPIALQLTTGTRIKSGRLLYRVVDQSKAWQSADMQMQGDTFAASIPGDYSKSPYPIEYYFELSDDTGRAKLHPGFNADLSNQPYYAIRQA